MPCDDCENSDKSDDWCAENCTNPNILALTKTLGHISAKENAEASGESLQ